MARVLAARLFTRALPILQWAPKYNFKWAQADFIAGLTVGLMVVPQSLAYASSIAGLPNQYGLYSSFMGVFVYCFFGSSKDVTLGPTAIMSLMVRNNAGKLAGQPTQTDPLQAVALSFFSGAVQLIMGILRLGFLIDFISYPVISGFTSSAAVTIAGGQLKHLIGVKTSSRDFIPEMIETFEGIPHMNSWDWTLGVGCIFLVLALEKLKHCGTSKRNRIFWLVGTARNFVVVVVAALVAYGVEHKYEGQLSLIGSLPSGLPKPTIPDLSKSTFENLIVKSIPVALIGFLESIAIAKAFARMNKYEVDSSQELVAIGTANVISAFFLSFPVTGSFSRTAVNAQSGVRTPAAGIVTGAVVIVALAWMTSLFFYIPQASLGAIIIVAVLQMFDYKIVMDMWRVSKLDLVPWAIAFVGSTVWSITIGVGAAMGCNILLILYTAARPGHISIREELIRGTASAVNIAEDYEGFDHITALRVGGRVLYPSASSFKEMVLARRKEDESKAVVLDFIAAPMADYTGILALKELVNELQEIHVRVYFARLHKELLEMMDRSGIWELSAVCFTDVPAAIQAAAAYTPPASTMDSGDASQPLLPVH